VVKEGVEEGVEAGGVVDIVARVAVVAEQAEDGLQHRLGCC
jgi:hypothetical protein